MGTFGVKRVSDEPFSPSMILYNVKPILITRVRFLSDENNNKNMKQNT